MYGTEAQIGIGNRAEPFSRRPQMLQFFSVISLRTTAFVSTREGAVARPFPGSVDGPGYSP